MKIENLKNCNGCSACYNACPKDAIKMVENSEGFLYPQIDKNLCVECGLCDAICPILNTEDNKKSLKLAYACYSRNEEVVKNSSSGGIFYHLAKSILDKNGIVFGAIFDSEFRVYHDYIENILDLHKIQGSKYVQSDIGNSYKVAKTFLDNEKLVLFSGTPCQIHGLKNFLGKTYDNLLTVDIICHGVPTPKLWNKYLKGQNAQIKSINFRDKRLGWNKYGIKILFTNKKEKFNQVSGNPYLKLFLNNLCLRNSCYNCNDKSLNRYSDITIADFWGINNVCPEMYNEMGTSLIFINSVKGKNIFNKINNELVYKKVDINEAVKYNSAAIKSAKKNKNREKFFKLLNKKTTKQLCYKFCKTNYFKKLINLIKRVIKKIFRILKLYK